MPPSPLVRHCKGVEFRRPSRRVVHPLAQQRRAIDQVDGQAIKFVLVREISPQGVIRQHLSQRLESQGLQAPRTKQGMPVTAILDVNLHAMTQVTRVLVKGWLEPALAQEATV